MVALVIYGLSAFSNAVRFFALKSMVHDSPLRLKLTSVAFAEPSRSSVTVTVVCLAITAILVPGANRCPIRENPVPAAGRSFSAAGGLVATLPGSRIYPMLNDTDTTPSSHLVTDPEVWNRTSNGIGRSSYLGKTYGTDDVSPHAAPTRMQDLSGLAPATVLTGDLDLFVHEVVQHAQRLMQAGVPTELHVYRAAHHGFDRRVPTATVTQRFIADRDSALRQGFTAARHRCQWPDIDRDAARASMVGAVTRTAAFSGRSHTDGLRRCRAHPSVPVCRKRICLRRRVLSSLGRATDLNRCCPGSVGSLRAVRPIAENGALLTNPWVMVRAARGDTPFPV